uniref:RNA helicase aquarius N-terminal domain-containing protein n=1 Tax=Rhizophora mucronata TaxID=61149 RepID=A0A2P2K8C4_RHIMU
MTKVYGTGAYDFKRHRVAEYPVELSTQVGDKPVESKPGSTLPSSITLSEIQRDRLTKIAAENWLKTGGGGVGSEKKRAFDSQLVKQIYETELKVKEKEGRRPVPLQRVMILEVSQYLENYLWPNFDPETATFEHVMSMILMVNEKFRENVAAWLCFYDRKDVLKGFLQRVLRLKEGRDLNIAEKTNYLVFMINSFQSLEDEIVSETVLRLAGLQSWHSLSYGRFQMELCLNPELIKKWKRMIKREAKEAIKQGDPFDPLGVVEVKFLRNLIEEFLDVLDFKVFSQKNFVNEDDTLDASIMQIDDAAVLYCERFMEFLIDLLSQLPTRRYTSFVFQSTFPAFVIFPYSLFLYL